MSDITGLMGGFNADKYQDKPEYDNSPLPEGDYYVQVETAVIKETANKKGVGCNITFTILGDVHEKAHEGRKLFQWYTLQHENEIAQNIGQEQFHGLRLAVDQPELNDTDRLIGCELVVAVGFDRKDPTRNQIKKCKKLDGYKAGAPKPKKDAPAAEVKSNPWD